ncbi:MAG TPA: Azurin [Phycisphaeraceae bacterium]|nr:Azurin [Phycisphaeraceae bacterium]
MKLITQVILLVAMSFTLVSCSGDKSGGADKVTTITITANDQMQYDKTEFKVKSGDKIRLVLKNIGTMPKTAMGHNVTILKAGESAEAFGAAIPETNEGTLENDFLPPSMADKVFVHTDMTGGGETTEITFTAPAPGTYEYLCTFPAHYMTMHGKMIVE